MDATLFVRGIIIGFSIAAPVGPIGVLCIRRTLADGLWAGLLSGLGAATADALYGTMAAFGLTFITSFLVDQARWFQLVGGLFLCYLGIKTLLARHTGREENLAGPLPPQRQGYWGAYLTTFALTLTNPVTILSFVAIFAGMGLGNQADDTLSSVTLVLGVFLGSGAWWLLLSGGTSMLRERFNPAVMLWINRLSGIIILGFGTYALVSLITKG